MNLVSKEVYFCSDLEFQRFKQALQEPEVLQKISDGIKSDAEEVWFALYRSITSEKNMAERQLEKQLRRRQKAEHKRLLNKRKRLDVIKQTYIRREHDIQKIIIE